MRLVARAPAVPVSFELRPAAGPWKTGAFLGDPAFDAAFVLEAAPVDVVGALLDGQTRAWLLGLGGLLRSLSLAGGVVRLSLRGRPDPLTRAEAGQMVARLAERLPGVHADAEAALLAGVRAGAPFRPVPDAQALRRVQAARAGELAWLGRVRRRRIVESALIGLVLALLALALGPALF